MIRRPRLVLRYGKGGSPSSPTSSAGYALQGAIGGAIGLGLLAAAFGGQPFFLLGLAVVLILLRDAWAWFAATEEERAAFRAEVEQRGLLLGRPGPDQVSLGASWGTGTLASLSASLAACLALAFWVTPLFLVASMFVASFLAAGLLDRVRAALRARGRGKSSREGGAGRTGAR